MSLGIAAMKDHVAVLVPCYNESKTIEKSFGISSAFAGSNRLRLR